MYILAYFFNGLVPFRHTLICSSWLQPCVDSPNLQERASVTTWQPLLITLCREDCLLFASSWVQLHEVHLAMLLWPWSSRKSWLWSRDFMEIQVLLAGEILADFFYLRHSWWTLPWECGVQTLCRYQGLLNYNGH